MKSTYIRFGFIALLVLLLPLFAHAESISTVERTGGREVEVKKNDSAPVQVNEIAELTAISEHLSILTTRIEVIVSRLSVKGIPTISAETTLAKAKIALLALKSNIEELKGSHDAEITTEQRKEFHKNLKDIRALLLHGLFSLKQSIATEAE